MARAKKNVAALNAAVTATVGGQIEEGGVAVLEKPKVARTPRAPKQKEVKATEKAAVAEVPVNAITLLDAFEESGLNLHDKSITSDKRKLLVAAAVGVCISVGLAEKSGGGGNMLRATFLRLLGGKLAKKVVQRQDITAGEVMEIMNLSNFKVQALAALESYLEGLKKDVEPTVIAGRAKQADVAKRWIEADLNETYCTALKIIKGIGNYVTFDGVGTIQLDRCLGVAFGRSITASELNKALGKTVHAKQTLR